MNHYYAFGGLFGEGVQTSNQPYKYNGKELNRMHGLDLFDYGARHYDAAIGRWFTVDPLAEKYYGISPYVYVANSPVRFIDPNGMWYDDYIVNHEKKHIERIKTTDKTDRIFDGSNLKGTIVEKGEFNVEEYKNQGYSVNTVVASGMAITDLGLSVLGGEMAFAKIGAWIGKGISALRASRAAKVAETSVEAGANAAREGGRVFWSGGGNPAVEAAAREFATKKGMTTLEMTRAGQNMMKLTEGLSWDKAGPMWKKLSSQFAKGANGSVHVFQNSGGIGVRSVWGTVEYPILKQNEVIIIYHTIP